MTRCFTRILVPTALTRNCFFALRHAVRLATDVGAEIRVVHVIEPLSEDARITLMSFIQDATTRGAAIDRRRQMISETLRDRLAAFWDGLPEDQRAARERTTAEVVEGFPAEAILQEARAKACDLIVLGAHEQGVTHTFLGSVAKRVLRRAETPTLIVPNRRGD
jgi:nucleotide-binding universal stress UspA family protein